MSLEYTYTVLKNSLMSLEYKYDYLTDLITLRLALSISLDMYLKNNLRSFYRNRLSSSLPASYL